MAEAAKAKLAPKEVRIAIVWQDSCSLADRDSAATATGGQKWGMHSTLDLSDLGTSA
jgi:hypothetical protein